MIFRNVTDILINGAISTKQHLLFISKALYFV